MCPPVRLRLWVRPQPKRRQRHPTAGGDIVVGHGPEARDEERGGILPIRRRQRDDRSAFVLCLAVDRNEAAC